MRRKETRTDDKKVCVIYARFSSSGQREESIEGQERECRAFAQRKGWQILAVYADRAISGTTDKRPQFQKMIADSAKGQFQIVLCWKHDRFARNRYDAAMYKARLKQNGVCLEYAAETVPAGAEGIILDSVMEGYAEYYSANLSQNVLRGIYDSALQRRALTKPPFGLLIGEDHKYVLDEFRAPIVKRVFEEFAAGVSSAEIVRELTAEGINMRNGNPLTKNFIPSIIKNEKFKGLYRYADIEDENGIPAIVSAELWEKANAMLEKHRRSPASKQTDEGYILTGKLYCGHCKEAMVAGSGTGKSGRLFQYYACNGRRFKKNGCKKKYTDKEWIESAVVNALFDIVMSDEIVEMFADRFESWQQKRAESNGRAAAEAECRELDRKIANVTKAIADGSSSKSLVLMLEDLERQREDMANAISRMMLDEPVLDRDDVKWFLLRFREGDIEDPRFRAKLVEVFLQRAYLFDDGRLLLQMNYSGDCSVVSVDAIESALASPLDSACSQVSTNGLPYRDNANKPIVAFFGGILVASVILKEA